MSLGHAFAWRILPVAWVPGYIVGANDPFAREGRREHRCVARHRKFGKGFGWRPGQGVEHVALPGLILDIVEEGAEFGTGQLDPRIGDDLDEFLKIGLDRKSVVSGKSVSERVHLGVSRVI